MLSTAGAEDASILFPCAAEQLLVGLKRILAQPWEAELLFRAGLYRPGPSGGTPEPLLSVGKAATYSRYCMRKQSCDVSDNVEPDRSDAPEFCRTEMNYRGAVSGIEISGPMAVLTQRSRPPVITLLRREADHRAVRVWAFPTINAVSS